MLRHAATRLLVRPQTAVRPLATSSTHYVKIRSSQPPSQQPSPAERPPPPPADIPTPPPSSASPAAPLSPESSGDGAVTPEEPSVPFDRSKLPSLDIDPEAAIAAPKAEGADGEKRERTGAGRKEYVSSIERQRRTMLRMGLIVLAVGGAGTAWYLSNEDASRLGGEASMMSRYDRFKTNMSEIFDVFNKPAFKVLLPDPLPPPHQRPYTLVVDLEGLLVSSTWDRKSGWRTAKRPGLDYFLAYLSQFYEIVLFTDQPLYTAIGVSEKIDPWGAFIPYKLFRESTRYVDGKVVKDLSYLNRDLSKVILLDTNPEHASLQPENSIIVKPWTGQPGDKGLVEMIPFLEAIGIYNVKDVRPILESYAGKNIPVEYAKKEAEDKRKVIEDWERSRAGGAGAGSGWLSNMFGSVAAPGASRPDQPMTYLEQKRAFFQKAYQEEQKYWRDHADEFNKMVEEDKKRQMQEMRGSLLGFMTGAKKDDKAADPAGKI